MSVCAGSRLCRNKERVDQLKTQKAEHIQQRKNQEFKLSKFEIQLVSPSTSFQFKWIDPPMFF